MSEAQLTEWLADRARQASHHPAPHVRSRGDHYRRKNNGIALRTFRNIIAPRWREAASQEGPPE